MTVQESILGAMSCYSDLSKLLPCMNVIIQIPSHRWSTSTSTRSPPSAPETSVLRASTARRPCTLASACSATPCLTGRSSPSPSAASSSARPSSSATTGRSRAHLGHPPPLHRPCKWVCDSFVSACLSRSPTLSIDPLPYQTLPPPSHRTSDGFINMDLEHNVSPFFN